MLALVALLCLATSEKVSPVQKVVQLLDELKAKVEVELAGEETLMQEFSKWCDVEANEREDSIRMADRTAEDQQATIEDMTGTINGLSSEVGELTQKIGAAERDVKAATDIRDHERADFKKTEAEMTETVDTLERAIIVLKRGQTSFMQQKATMPKDFSLLVAGLSTIVQAAWVNSAQREAVQALLQSGDSDEDLALQPAATVAAYESKGGGILDVLGDLQEKATAALSEARKTEMEQQHAFEMLKQGLGSELTTQGKRLVDAQSASTEASEQMHTAEGELAGATKSSQQDTKYLTSLKTSCAQKEEEWGGRQQSAQEEIQAIAKAREILSDNKAFLQVRSKNPAEEAKREQLVTLLSQMARSSKIFALQQIASSAASDPFEKVRTMIETMIANLLEGAAQEADSKAFCEGENAKSRQKQKELSAKLDMHSRRIEKGASGKAALALEVKDLDAEVAEIDAGQAEATKIRQAEKSQYESSTAEWKEGAAAIANAMEVLQQYYAGSFVQLKTARRVSSASGVPAPAFGGSKGDSASGIIGLLEVAESDLTRMITEAQAQESAAQRSFDDLSQENRVAKASKSASSEAKRGEIKSLEVNLLNYKEDHSFVSKELDATLSYIDKLKPQCETKVMSYGERKARREQEIEGLKEALQILSAE